MSAPQMNMLSPTLQGQSTGRTSYYSGLAFRTCASYARPGMDDETCQVTSDACSNGSFPVVTVPTVMHVMSAIAGASVALTRENV